MEAYAVLLVGLHGPIKTDTKGASRQMEMTFPNEARYSFLLLLSK